MLCEFRWWFSPDTSIPPTNKTENHDITEILLKVALNTINQNKRDHSRLTVNYGISPLKFYYLILNEFNLVVSSREFPPISCRRPLTTEINNFIIPSSDHNIFPLSIDKFSNFKALAKARA
jgi:hypothetical protein